MEEYQGGSDQKGFDYSSPTGGVGGGVGPGGLGQQFAEPNPTSSANPQQLANFNQYANYSISPQQSLHQPSPHAAGYTYDPSQVYNTSPQMLYSPQPMPWTGHTPIQSPQWLMNAHAHSSTPSVPSLVHAGTSSAVDSSRWTSAYNHPASAGLLPSPYGAVPPMGSQSWDTDATSSLSSSARLKPFIEKLYNILAQPASFRDCLVWDEAGTAFIVSHANPRLLQQVLPDAFGHSNLHSFTRQLNIYGFTRCTSAELLSKLDVTSTADYSGWRHPLFTRNDSSQLHLLNPRPSRARQLKKDQKAAKDAEKDAELRIQTYGQPPQPPPHAQ